MIISFSGAQSTGKTTLLKKMEEMYPEFEYVPEVTRLVKREYNLPINEDGNDLTQMMIGSTHMYNAYRQYEKSVILDRCSLDGIVYSMWLYEKKKISSDAFYFMRSVFFRTKDMYDVIFYTDPTDVKIEDDGERSTSVEFRDEIIQLFEYFRDDVRGKIVTVSGSVKERLKQIKEYLQLA